MVAFPPCKINLGLHVTRKRNDGYHDIETCFFPLPFTDILEVIPSDTFSFSSSGIAIPGNDEDNLCVNAFRLLKKDFAFGEAAIHLHKIIPSGAGLGGGSSDAAYTLRLVNDVFNLGLTTESLCAYASRLGSDCAFFIYSKPMLGFSRGEVLKETEVDLQGKYIVLLNPGIHISTADAYAGVMPMLPTVALNEIIAAPVQTWKDTLFNDFEKSVFKKHPEIATLKESLYQHGAVYASMSGSGSSVFGIFEREPTITDTAISKYVVWMGKV